MRVVSLVPSVTETLLAWGIAPVAVTRFCEQPSLPAVGGTKDPDVSAIVELAPDLVVMCNEENRIEDHDAIVAAGLRVEALRIESIADVNDAMTQLAGAVDLDEAAAPAPFTPPPFDGTRRTAFVPIWRRPWMTLAADTFGASMLDALGIEVILAAGEGRYPEMDLIEAATRRPDLVLATSEPYPFAERHVAELEAVAPVLLVDGQDLFWWGARSPAAFDRLAEALSSTWH